MALYEVQRTDEVQPGEFVSAVVVAKGAALARKSVAHHAGVTRKNVVALPLEARNANYTLSVEYDEREPLTPELPLTD